MTGNIATLGPEKTFSDHATRQFLKDTGSDLNICYFPSIKKVFHALQEGTCSYGVVPIENISEGHVQVSLDLLVPTNINIIHELILPIRFSFVANTDISQVNTVYTQFVSQGQCSEFLDQFDDRIIILTQSNMESLNNCLVEGSQCGAVVPRHALEGISPFPTHIDNIHDYQHNQTRFFVLGNQQIAYDRAQSYKTSLVVFNRNDRPGMLRDILNIFSEHDLNMTSIMSRPTREEFGQYHFFIDVDRHQNDPALSEAVKQIEKDHQVKLLGCYLRAQ